MTQAKTILQNNLKKFNEDLPFLSNTLLQLLDGKEKKYGCFQLIKEEGWLRLEIPYLPILRFYKNDTYNIFKVHWSERKELYPGEEIEDKTLSILIKKSQRKTFTSNTNNSKRQETIQKVYEIIIRNNFKEETRLVNQILAKLIQERIEDNLTRTPVGDVHPLVTIVEAT
jgi:DNA polymerase III delta prime subunit